MGEVILGIVWLVIGGGLAWRYIVSRRRHRASPTTGLGEKEHTIRESRAAGYGINIRGDGGA